jgi:hypothetical protein
MPVGLKDPLPCFVAAARSSPCLRAIAEVFKMPSTSGPGGWLSGRWCNSVHPAIHRVSGTLNPMPIYSMRRSATWYGIVFFVTIQYSIVA